MTNYPVVSYNDVTTQSSLYVPQTLDKKQRDSLSPVPNRVEEAVYRDIYQAFVPLYRTEADNKRHKTTLSILRQET